MNLVLIGLQESSERDLEEAASHSKTSSKRKQPGRGRKRRSDDSPLDETLLTLRSKKIKKNKVNVDELDQIVSTIFQDAYQNDNFEELILSRGGKNISINKLRKLVGPEAKKYTDAQIKKSAGSCLSKLGGFPSINNDY